MGTEAAPAAAAAPTHSYPAWANPLIKWYRSPGGKRDRDKAKFTAFYLLTLLLHNVLTKAPRRFGPFYTVLGLMGMSHRVPSYRA